MSYPITRTKIIPPRIHKDLLSRPRLLAMLDGLLDYRLILVTAPAGYGKTSLLADLAARVEYPVCWLALDPLDSDLPRFLNYLVAAIEQQFPDFGIPSRSLISDPAAGNLDLEQILGTIVNDLYNHIQEHFALVLDDFHLVESNPAISQFLNRFVQEMDENCHLAIASRTLLGLPDLPLLVGRSQVCGVSFEELAFNPDEIRDLYQIRYQGKISQDDAARMAAETEGWITGFLLSAETAGPGLPGPQRAARAAGIGLYDYLAQQVLDQQTPELQEFLLRTSLLEEFDQELCQQALGDPPGERGWGDLIQELLHKNLFVQPVENEGTWLRYHQLFRDFLQQHFQNSRPDQARELLQKLAAVYQERGWLDRAYAVLQRLDDESLTAAYIKAVSPALVHSGQVSLLKSWLEALSPELIERDPGLLAIQGGLASLSGDPVSGLWTLNRALARSAPAADPALQAMLLIRRAACHRLLGSYQLGLEDAHKAFQLAQELADGKRLAAESEREIGLNQHRLGMVEQARAHLERSLASYLAEYDHKNAAFVETSLGLMEMNQGNYPAARSYYRQACQLWEESGNLSQLVGLCNNLGVLDHLTGAYQAAFGWFSRALGYARQTGNPRESAYTLASLGDLALDLGALSRGESYHQEAGKLAEEAGEVYLNIYLELAAAALARRREQPEAARNHLEAVHYQIRDYPPGIEKGRYHLERGLLLADQRRFDQAYGDFQAARENFQAVSLPVEACLALLYLARLDCLAGSLSEAEKKFQSVREQVRSLGTLQPLVPALFVQEDLLACLEEHLPEDPLTGEILRAVSDFQSGLSSLLESLDFNQLPFQTSRAPLLEIRALGGIDLQQGGKAVSVPEWTKQKTVRELLVYLMSHTGGASREEICLVFWPESSPEQLKKQFKNAFYRLRRALGKEIILYDSFTQLYHFNRDLDYRYDVETFQAALARAQGEKDPERKLQQLQAAAALYQGPFAPEIDGIWAEPLRHWLYQGYERASLAVAETQLAQGLVDACLETAAGLLEANPGQEAAWRLELRCHAARADRSGIERVYQRCQQALERELRAEPSEETRALYQQLMA